MIKDDRRTQILEIIKREFVGPDPVDVDGLIQENGEEILSSDAPRIRYIAGILFPQGTGAETSNDQDHVDMDQEATRDDWTNEIEGTEARGNSKSEVLQDAEELINLSNAYRQSAISMTASVYTNTDIHVFVNAGTYSSIGGTDSKTGRKKYKYPRAQINWDKVIYTADLPAENSRIKCFPVFDSEKRTGLEFVITYRYTDDKNNSNVYTFTLKNANKTDGGKIHDRDCYFQTEFYLQSSNGFAKLPDYPKVNLNDEDYQSNRLMYRDVAAYAIGHGCSVEWDETLEGVNRISTTVFPTFEVKPIVPSSFEGISLSMFKMSDLGDFEEALEELQLLCDKYLEWINEQKSNSVALEPVYQETARRHINNCVKCHQRICDGISILKSDEKTKRAFRYMNRAMLLQQLHYNMPLQEWDSNVEGILSLKNPIPLPDIADQNTWVGDPSRYGKWRPFQIAFIIMNLRSMLESTGEARGIVDLIWFPTGGGKTEAYLGLSAYTIFLRKLKNCDDTGTAILMRYTLRLLTAQQYERAASMICACELIRQEKEEELGTDRITIGLWVGKGTTPNKNSKAIAAYNSLYNGKTDENPFIILKCPWCGAKMGPVHVRANMRKIPGYYKTSNRKGRIKFKCANLLCCFSELENTLPLEVVDELIYETPPTLLLGTVDKFAMLPYRPEAKRLFGIYDDCRKAPPDLIIQDELHLISGPLGSMVGHYETLIAELCTDRRGEIAVSPKVIASTATISRAKEQCHALYGCGEENVLQFPPSGLNAGDSFFALEDKSSNGREYVGIFAASSSSAATTSIRLFASLLYAGKAIDVNSDEERDGYWTNLGYFNSIRELGQTATWISADIAEYLHTIYKRRHEDKEEGYRENRRYISCSEELTSRIRSDRIPQSLQKLSIAYRTDGKKPVDICLATNMVSVGVDIPRLGLMTVVGQPKTTSEYIQATSRVGRSPKAPGIVFTIYNPGRPRDKSHYEQFQVYHSRLYSHVEPTSVTPFSAPLRERALHAVFIGLVRLIMNSSTPRALPQESDVERLISLITDRVRTIDEEELFDTEKHIREILKTWKAQYPQVYDYYHAGDAIPLMYPSGMIPKVEWGGQGFATPTSMRNVDASCEAYVINNEYVEEEE